MTLRASHFTSLNSLNVSGVIRRVYKAFHAREMRAFRSRGDTVKRKITEGRQERATSAHARTFTVSAVQLHGHDQYQYRRLSGRSRQRRPFASWKTRDRPTRTTAGDRVPKKFRRREARRRQIRPAAALSYLLRAPLCPRVITFRGSLTPDNYSAVVVNFPGNKRPTTSALTLSRSAIPGGSRERRYQFYDFHGPHKDDPFSLGRRWR